MSEVLDLGDQPIVHDYLGSADEAFAVYPFRVVFCEGCGLLQVAEPIAPELLYSEYLCLSSWKYQPHVDRLVGLIERFGGGDREARILEVGSNDGMFLDRLRSAGYRRLTGIEPASDACRAAWARGLETVAGYFDTERAAAYVQEHGPCDVFVSRQMLEHVAELAEFGEAMQAVLRPGGVVVMEVPDTRFNLDWPDYALWEEHVNYFVPETLGYFLARWGVEVVHAEAVLFSGQSLVVVGRYHGPRGLAFSRDYLPSVRAAVMRYRGLWPVFRERLQAYVGEHRRQGRTVAVYGAGARVCCLVNFTGIGGDVAFVVDDHPGKQGVWLPGSRLAVVPSAALEAEGVDVCLLGVNTECEEQVIGKHGAFTARGGQFVSVLPPSDRLPGFWKALSAAGVQGGVKAVMGAVS